MASAHRLSRVTLALVAAGALLGALCGLVALAPLLLQQWLRPTPDDGLVGSASDWAPYVATVGAACGAGLGPALALGLLRAVPLWRVGVALLAGAALGTLAAWAVAFAGVSGLGLAVLPLGAAAGAAAAALWLRRRARSHHTPAA